MGTRTADCRKFSPNIFNKSKCSHCFRHREEHSAAALECNRASRKVSKCGYLFVAPDWDFNNPLYRTKRWQRRWFVLYDDGQLTYSVDEHPETVPQAVIDMTKVIEVTTAEDVTGHSSSIAITAPDRVTFVKGTCPEESKWWLNILVAYPKSKGRHKRNATFPGGQTTTKLQQTSANPGCGLVARNRHNSYHKDVLTGVPNPASVDCWDLTNSSNGSNDRNIMDNVSGLDDPINNGPGDCHQQSSGGQDENNKNAGNEITNRVSPCLLIENVRREEKLKHIANTITNLSQSSNRWSTSSVNTNKVTTTLNNALNSQSQGLNDERPTRDETDFPISRQQQTTIVNLRPKSLPLASNSTPAIVSAIVKKIPPVVDQKCDNNNKSSPKLQQQLRILQQRQQTQPRSHERGDPDGGCNLDDLSTNYLAKTSELRVNLPAEEILHSKKGWLMKQDSRTGDWTKHWFVLSGAALFYYRDAVSEERGVLDGVLDVNSLTSVCEVNTSRNNAFQMVTWDKRRLVLSALSANSRNSWITMLRNAAGIKSEPEVDGDCIPTTELIIEDSTLDENKNDIENEFIKAQKAQQLVLTNNNKNSAKISQDTNVVTPQKAATTPITPVTPKNTMFSSDEEYRTASEGGRRDSVDWGSPVSPSSPLPTALFRARERIKSRPSCPRMHKRSRSSPPNSRRNTVDSMGSDELPVIHSVQEEFHVDKELQFRLNVAERERDILRDEAKEREARMSELLTTLERTEQELNARIREMEEARDNLSSQLDEAKRNAEKIVDRLTVELEESQTKIKDLEDRLSLGIEENEGLYKKLREIESCSPSSFSNLNRHKLKRMDSLSDLTQISDIDPYCLDRDMLADEYSELRSRFEKAVCEIKAMKRELKESQNQFDNLEITYASLRQDLERQRIEDHSQLQMMAERIQDLTLKYSGSERQVRTLKQKLAKSERRRSLSLKGKEQLTVSKELENKVTELESKIDELEKKSPSATKVGTSPLGRKSVRRRSLESSASTDSLHVMMHVNELEKRIEGVVSPASEVSSAPSIDIQRSLSSPKISEHLIDRLKCLEGVLICSKERLEYCLHQLHTRKSPSRSRRSVSPNVDRKDQYKFIEQCIGEVLQMIKESCETCVNKKLPTSQFVLLPDTHPIKNALVQLESQLRAKLADLLKQRRMLRERNELTPSKDLELLAERIAFESVCFGRLQESMVRAENPEAFHQMLTCSEIAETSHLISTLKAKISGKCIFKPSGSLDILAGVLARRLVLSSTRKERPRPSDTRSLEPKLLDELLRQQNEVNLIAKRYKNNTMENLAAGLAAETLSYMASNDLVQGAIQEAWRQAQEIVNAELVQTEIAHIMTKNAKRLEDAITPSFGYALTTEERLTFESFADAVQESMRKEMDTAIEQLSQCYQEALQKMKRGQWRMSFEQDRNSSEGRQLLAEFADVIAHKALIDARIAILKGDFNTSRSTNPPTTATATKANLSSVSTLRKYENLFEELTTDLQISNADDILVEADFEFMYKNRTIDFLNDPATLKEVANFLSQLERSIEELRCTLQPNLRPKLVSKEIHTLQDVCQKCFELHTRALSLAKDVQHMTVTCSNCSQLQNTICNLQVDHESKVSQLQKDHGNDMSILLHRVESHRNTIEGLERERDALAKEIHQQRNLVENRGRQLTTITMKLKSKEEECHRKEKDNLDLMDRLEDRNEQIRNHQLEKDNLEKKCSRQDDQYAVLLQERDFIQAELNKERELGRRMERRLEMLENEHSKQLECLQEAYRDQILSHCSDFTNIADEESFRQRYQTEIEQLRTLCEKGLSAMESSHRRIIHDLEEKHRKEIDRLLVEKETALAEETQATLAALDAMRKAHQSEVQREVARFKQEFIRQFQKGEHPVDSTKIKEEELEELRQEILSFSEKYSIKCVENAALEEKLRSANQKLKHFQQMQQLELRNKQFRAHLASENPSTDINFVQGLTSKEEITSADSEV